MGFYELEKNVIQWAAEKGILEKATPLAQCEKTIEEVDELFEALQAQEKGLSEYENSKSKIVNTKEEIIDGIGDSIVTLIIQAKMQGVTLTECLDEAYNVIKNRNGKMISGKFVKD